MQQVHRKIKVDNKLSDIGAERAVLACLFNFGIEAYVEISDIINHQSFAHENNQVIFKCIEKSFESTEVIDVPSLLAAAKQLDLLEIISTEQELSYIKSLMDFPAKLENVTVFAAQVKKFEFARKAKKIAKRISNNVDGICGDESIEDIISLVEMPLMDFLRDDNGEQGPEILGNDIEGYIEYLCENKCDQIGLTSGFPRFDAVIGGGLRRKCVDIVSARPGIGKSTFADNVAIHNALKGIPVLMIDTEMGKEDHLNRILSNISGVPMEEIATGKFSSDEDKFMKVKLAAEKIKDIPYTYISVAGWPYQNILNAIKKWILREVGQDENGRTNDCLVVYDYLKLMSSSNISTNVQEYQALGFQITDLHNLAVKYDFPCLSFIQLNRDGITREDTSVASGSDRIVWLCTSFSIFKAKSQEELAEDGPTNGNRKIVTLKARHGPGLMDGNYINMNMIGSHSKILELRTRDETKSRPDDGILEGAELPVQEEE